jgi:hypothetical protein
MYGYHHHTSDDWQKDIQKPDLKGNVPGQFGCEWIVTVNTHECIHNIGGKSEIFAGQGHHVLQSISPDGSEKEAREALPEIQTGRVRVKAEYARTNTGCIISVHHHLLYTLHHMLQKEENHAHLKHVDTNAFSQSRLFRIEGQ